MATLNTLRTKGGWIVSIVIGIALLAFLIGDLASGNSVFGVKEKVGKIDGNKISYIEYVQKVDYLTEVNKIISGTESLSAQQSDAIRNYAWEMLINETVVFPGLEAMGIEVTEDEMFDRIYGNNISQVLLNAGFFTDPQTGVYDKALVQNFVSNYKADQTGRSAMLWKYLQDQVRQDALMSKYLALVSGLSYVTGFEAERGVKNAAAVYNARFVSQPYSSIPDSLVKIQTSDARKFYDARKENFKRAASRDIEYIVFEVVASQNDFAAAEKTIHELAVEFAEADNLQQYVMLNSHDSSFDEAYYTREQLPAAVGDFAFAADNSGILGPYREGNVYRVHRVNDVRTFPDTIALRQMAFAPGMETLADSVFNALRKDGNFEALAGEYSMIPLEGMDMGRISTQMIPMEIGEQLYSTREKYIKIQNANGTFLFDVYYRGGSSLKVQLAELTYHVEPSSATQQAAYEKASAFYTATAGLVANFDKIAVDSTYSKRVATVQAGQSEISGLENGREMIRWAFNAKTGSISSIMEIDNNYVIATLTGSREDGYASLEEVMTQVSVEMILQKKGEMLAEKMQGATSLDALAQTLSTTVGELSEVTYNVSYIPEVGFEPILAGAIVGLPEGRLSKPVKGMSGVYVVEITSKTDIETGDAEMEKVRLEAQAQYNIGQRAYEALIRKSNVVDGRSKYF